MVMNKSRVEISRKVFNHQMSEVWTKLLPCSNGRQKCLNDFKVELDDS